MGDSCSFIEEARSDIFAETSFLGFQGALNVMMHLPAWASERLRSRIRPKINQRGRKYHRPNNTYVIKGCHGHMEGGAASVRFSVHFFVKEASQPSSS